MATFKGYDLIVVGSGFGGSFATLSYLETLKASGKSGRVALVEVGKDGERCGASRWTMAYLRLDKDLNFDKDWVKEMRRVSDGIADETYCEKLRHEAPITAKYCEDHGVKFIHHDEPNVLLEFDTDQHFVFPDGGGNAIITKIMEHIKSYSNADIHWETEALKLLQDDRGAIRGLKVRKSDGLQYDLLAPDVVLACGGFEGNQEMLARYIGRDSHKLPLIAPGIRYNKGAGLRMALEHVKISNAVSGHNYGIVVNKDCKRFYDEGQRHLFATFEMIALYCWKDHNQSCYFVTDDPIMQRFKGSWVYETTDQPPEQADTIEGLAEKLGLDPQQLKKTVDEYNAAVNDKPFDLMKLDGKATTGLSPNKTNWAAKIEKGPFYGYPMTANLTFTYGGVKTDLDARVVSTNDVPIPGLWAAGEMTGLFYNEYPPATSCLRSMTFGRLAGESIAKKQGQKQTVTIGL
ncbi:uncharacterized protein MYCFIDRAFT_86959 [Pseudocercospora fijiensis CIRAD86]|uniref:FAD-dependent oxidoreductase 2 FAD-binding domain-containing protein n=1 Tax=Pseudocercospora fijiensis (strain CIRAD86) TaxID=383855 RepID=M2ZHV5_PSEFD|nr:uncharacterized protein MYCFIDRAFT_86959 [Pseudocercospora fijiensis CIRAD86]EME78694.1 hypothetical protein MYCFIDRAFT_86959 [Pseudocercospora fijiensis CIRAD86]